MSSPVLECIPNISEGRDPAVVDRVLAAVEAVDGVTVLDHMSDADHNRSVITFLGAPEAVLEGALALCRAAYQAIDMNTHSGAHPRFGAVDVLPLVPIRDLSMDDAAEYAHRLGRSIGELGVPVFFYEAAALSPERRNLAEVRRGQYEGLAERFAGGERPDAGPAELNPRTGAVAVGARPPLIAFNVNLGSDDLVLARRIADAVRSRTGGYECVKGMGVALPDKGQVQVSMNLTDFTRTPIHRVVETIRSEAARHGVPIVACELIGLAPLAAFEEVVRHYLQTPDFTSEQVIETHLL
ncbi:MAG: glutamate formimidoyltransferase [Actinobacteria bacterium]|nr:glutamate formimidoyltransferase [Actinomycetota bacterium]